MKKVVGRQTVDYVSRKTNQPVTGVTLHMTYNDDRIIGVGVESVFVSSRCSNYEAICQLGVGSEVDVFYNRYGAVEDIRPVKK